MRTQLWSLSAFAFLLWANSASWAATEVVFAQIADFSGRGKGISIPFGEGAKACIRAHNLGNPRKPVRLTQADDHFIPAESSTHAREAIQNGVIAVLGSLGGETSRAIADVTDTAGLPVVGAISGATSLRAEQRRSLFYLRASIEQEAVAAIKHFASINAQRIGILHTNDAYGKDAAQAAGRYAATVNLPELKTHAYNAGTTDAAQAAKGFQDFDGVVVFGSGQMLFNFVSSMRETSKATTIIAASSANMEALVTAIGITKARGVGYLRSLPSPSTKSSLGRSFLQIWKAQGSNAAPGPFHLEGCLAAQIALSALMSIEGDVSSQTLLRALKGKSPYQFSEFAVDFRNASNEGMSWVGIAVVDANGLLRD